MHLSDTRRQWSATSHTAHVKILQRKTDGIHQLVARCARFHRPMRFQTFTCTEWGLAPSTFSLSAGTLGGGGGAVTPRICSRTHLPRTTGEVRLGSEVTERMLPLAEQSESIRVSHRHSPEIGARDIGHAVMPGQTLIDKREVRRQHLRDTAILPHEGCQRTVRFPSSSTGRGCRRNPDRDKHRAADL